jgi:hypothetical protein
LGPSPSKIDFHFCRSSAEVPRSPKVLEKTKMFSPELLGRIEFWKLLGYFKKTSALEFFFRFLDFCRLLQK